MKINDIILESKEIKTTKNPNGVTIDLMVDGKKDGKKAIANAVKRKKANDPNRNRKGKAKHVNNSPKK